MNIKFRIATIDDVKGIIELCNECFLEHTSLEYALDVFKKFEHDKNHIYIVGTCDGMIIAHTKITIVPTIFEGVKTYAILNRVCVKKEFRQHKVGMTLLKACEAVCKRHGCILMRLWSSNYRVPAHNLYKKYGFVAKDSQIFVKDIK